MHDEVHDCDEAANMVLLSPDASPDPKPTPAPLEDLPLVDLLVQASDTIRAERARADALEEECAALRARLDGVCAAYHRTAAQRLSSGQTASDELFTYVSQTIIHNKAGTSQPRQRSSSNDGSGGSHVPTTPSSSVGRAPSRGSVTAATQSYRRGWEAVAAASSTSRDATPTATAAAEEEKTTTRNTAAAAVASQTPSKTRNEHIDAAETSNTNVTAAPTTTAAAASPTVQAMAARIRRALAPRPAEAVVGDIIHSMVHGLQRDVQAALEEHQTNAAAAAGAVAGAPPLRRLRGFAMVRVRPCVYQLLIGPPAEVRVMARQRGGSANAAAQRRSASPPTTTPYRNDYLLYHTSTPGGAAVKDTATAVQARVHSIVVHLTIDSGSLSVIRGGGHVDFIEYLERLLRISLTGA